MTDQETLSAIWDMLTTVIHRVVDEAGLNVANAQVRRIADGWYLYVDEADGFDILTQGDFMRLVLQPTA